MKKIPLYMSPNPPFEPPAVDWLASLQQPPPPLSDGG